ncbi:MAG: YCF48-related protein [Bacteroidota bacterium]|nr:YCF48-related protein [Bacteroidota bacterium]
MFRTILIVQLTISLSQVALCQQGWYQLTSGTSYNLRSLCFTDINTGYAVGFNGTILKTTDGGLNWILQTVGTNQNLYSVHFIGQTGYVVGGTNISVIFRTTNGGTNWESQSDTGTFGLNSVFMADSMTAHAVGNKGKIIRTTNGGINWNVQTISFTYFNLNSIFFTDDNTGYIGGKSYIHTGGIFLKSSNGGISWSSPGESAEFKSVYFINSATGYGAYSGTVVKTTNSGASWTFQYLGSGNRMSSIWFTNLMTGYVAGYTSNNSRIFKTTNSGLNWNLQSTPAADSLYSVTFIDANTGYAAGNSGTILKTINGGVGILTLSNEIPTEYKLYQNYPNPFNPETNFKFQISNFSNVKVAIYDLRGIEIKVLVNEHLIPGTYEIKFDGSNYSSGIYYYSLNTEYYTDTRKMVLTK